MNSSFPSARASRNALAGRRVLIVGAGGLGCPAALALLETGVTLVLADDDSVEASNLHRQILYQDADIGDHKLDALARALIGRGFPEARLVLVRSRLLPENARELIRSVDLVLEGSDNYATKFLAADAARLEERPVVHGAAVRWLATVLAVAPRARPCYRCLFEDLPGGAQQNCAEAGVLGPVVGLAGALMADLALRALSEGGVRYGQIHTYNGQTDRMRSIEVPASTACSLCGTSPSIFDIQENRYTAPSCAA